MGGMRRKRATNGHGRIGIVYDVLDRLANRTDANGVSVAVSYDVLGRVLARSYPDGGRETFGYTPNVSAYTSYTNQKEVKP
jgi:YD repeat-containing protein